MVLLLRGHALRSDGVKAERLLFVFALSTVTVLSRSRCMNEIAIYSAQFTRDRVPGVFLYLTPAPLSSLTGFRAFVTVSKTFAVQVGAI